MLRAEINCRLNEPEFGSKLPPKSFLTLKNDLIHFIKKIFLFCIKYNVFLGAQLPVLVSWPHNESILKDMKRVGDVIPVGRMKFWQ